LPGEDGKRKRPVEKPQQRIARTDLEPTKTGKERYRKGEGLSEDKERGDPSEQHLKVMTTAL